MSRLDALPMYRFPKGFFEKLITGLSDRVMMFHAIYQQRVLSTELLLLSEDYLYSFLGGTLEEGFPLRANPLLRHEINLWARDHGKRQVLPTDTPMTNLYLSMLDRMGVPAERIGDSTGRLEIS